MAELQEEKRVKRFEDIWNRFFKMYEGKFPCDQDDVALLGAVAVFAPSLGYELRVKAALNKYNIQIVELGSAVVNVTDDDFQEAIQEVSYRFFEYLDDTGKIKSWESLSKTL